MTECIQSSFGFKAFGSREAAYAHSAVEMDSASDI
jgi:hypothetical protein